MAGEFSWGVGQVDAFLDDVRGQAFDAKDSI